MQNAQIETDTDSQVRKFRRAASATEPTILADIYQDDVNIAIWQQAHSSMVLQCVPELMNQNPNLKLILAVTSEDVHQQLSEHLGNSKSQHEIYQHITLLVDMFSTLFELERVGLRLMLLDRPMCPKFHVDKVPCRLVTTFCGPATQWLPNDLVERTKLGAGSLGLPDEQSGIMQSAEDIKHLVSGDVALLKGESWYDNEHAGLVHRSPSVNENEPRLLLTLDFIN